MHDVLREELRRLVLMLQSPGVPLIVGGGYGLLLRQRHIASTGARTLRAVPPARSTEDIDLFLTAELIADSEIVAALRDALGSLGYRPVTGAEYYQFVRTVDYQGRPRDVKIDLLAPLPQDEAVRMQLKYDTRRVRPKVVKNFHAHTTPEAFTIGEHLLAMDLSDPPERARIYIPHPFTYAILKLFAYRDRQRDEAKDHGRYHAFDIYRVLAMVTEPEWTQSLELRDRYAEAQPALEARRITHALFGGEIAPGVLALREHARDIGYDLLGRDVVGFLEDLHELFPRPE